jgi:hypothetical protein
MYVDLGEEDCKYVRENHKIDRVICPKIILKGIK